MTLQVFVQNPDSGEPWAFCGPALEDWEGLVKAIGHFAQAEAESAAQNGDKEFSLDFKLVEMTEEEIKNLPEI